MSTLLVIDSSARLARSHTRRLTRLFLERWRATHPRDEIIYRDVGTTPPPPVDERWIEAAFTETAERTAEMRAVLSLSDLLIDELERADVYALGVPMYNFGMPAQLKAYVDQVVRVGRTFAFDPTEPRDPYRPLLRGKTLVVLTSRGDHGYGRGGRLARWNHLDPHLETVFGFIGVDHIETIAVESDEFADERHRRSRSRAEDAVAVAVEEITRRSASSASSAAAPPSRECVGLEREESAMVQPGR